MNLPKAIEILEDIRDTGIDAGHYDAEDAINLGIEALEFLERWRSKAEIQPYPLLPSETTG